MRLVAVTILAVSYFSLARSQISELSAKALETAPEPIKLDKNLRQALLKALTDLEAESAEQRKDEDEKSLIMSVEKSFDDVVKRNLNKNIGIIPKNSFSFNGFPGDEEIPNEDKLQNSSFLEAKKYISSSPSMTIEKASRDDAKSFHVPNVITLDKNPTTYSPRIESPKGDSLETKTTKSSASLSSVNKIESITLKPFTQISESLTQSASNAFSNNNPRVTSKPIASATILSKSNVTSSPSNINKEKSPAEEVKIFQAPLVAAFTVQQDEQGVPKSVVPIYRQSGDGQALTLQEQLEFKQKLLEQQLAELQQQQIQQTQFLVRQRQLYEQQLRQKQQQFYFQEQARIKQLEEQNKIKQLEEQRLKQLEEQRIYRLHQQNRFPLQKQPIFEQTNALTLQPSLETTVHFQPSVTLELPNIAAPPLFRSNEQLHFQQLRQHPQQLQQLQQLQQPQQLHQPQKLQQLHQSQQLHQPQQLQQLHQPQQLQQLHQPQQLQQSQQLQKSQQLQLQQSQQQHQQRLQQTFGSFSTEFQPPLAPAARFNRQEMFGAVGNFGINLDNKQSLPSRNVFAFNVPPKNPNMFVYNPYAQFRQAPIRAQTPANQIQRLLYQSGVVGDLSNVQGPGGEDLNIVSKVLALNVGALPNKNYQYTTSIRSKLGSA